jgi:hypothetical protein
MDMEDVTERVCRMTLRTQVGSPDHTISAVRSYILNSVDVWDFYTDVRFNPSIIRFGQGSAIDNRDDIMVDVMEYL